MKARLSAQGQCGEAELDEDQRQPGRRATGPTDDAGFARGPRLISVPLPPPERYP